MIVEIYRKWLALNGDHHLAYVVYFNCSVTQRDSGDLLGAVLSLRESQRLNPDFSSTYINLGRALEDVGLPAEAIAEWGKGLAKLSAVKGEAVAQRLILLEQSGRLLEAHQQDPLAEEQFQQAIELNPSQLESIRQWIALRLRQCHWPAVTGTDRAPSDKRLAAISPLSLAAISDDPVFQLSCGYVYGKETVGAPSRKSLEAVAKFRAARSAALGRRLRIGYVSSDFREHAVGFAMTEVIELHDRAKFEIFAYYCGIERDDPTRRRIAGAADHWLDIRAMSVEEAAKRIAEDGIDILVDLNGYTKFAKTGVFALCPAPIQVNWFGYPGTMATPYHHYLIADPLIVPAGQEIHYSEEVLRLPCYQPNDRKRVVADRTPTRAEVGLPEDAFVFCSFNGAQKLTRRTFERWIAILNQAPNSVLWMLDSGELVTERLRQYALERGIARERIVLAAKLGNPHHLARYPLADLFLDAFPYGAHTTAADSLWMGVPVLTLTGRSFAARVCTSLVHAAGIGEMACDSEAKYIAKAVELTKDRARLETIKQRLKAGRLTCTLFDTDRLVKGLEGLYEQMVERHRLGRTPTPDLTNLATYHEIGTKLDYEKIDAMSDEDYFAAYREALAESDMSYPLSYDGRLWQAPIAKPTLRRAIG